MSGGKQLSQATARVAGEDDPAAKKLQWPKRGLHHDVGNLKERIVIKREIQEEVQEEQADQLLKMKTVIDAKSHEAAALQKKLNEIALSVECVVCLKFFGEHMMSLNCGRIFYNYACCGSSCPTCAHGLPITSRVKLSGAIKDIGAALAHTSNQDVLDRPAACAQHVATQLKSDSRDTVRKMREEGTAAAHARKDLLQSVFRQSKKDHAFLSGKVKKLKTVRVEDRA